MARAELIVIPMQGTGHIMPAVELSKRLVERDEKISITILVMNFPPFNVESYIKSLQADPSIDKRITFILLPPLETPPKQPNPLGFQQLITEYGPKVKQIIQEQVMISAKLPETTQPRQLAGLVVDFFCTPMIDVAKELNVPSYMFFTSGAGFLSLQLHLQSLRDDHGVEVSEELKDRSGSKVLDIPGFKNPVPARYLPVIFLEPDIGNSFLDQARKYRETSGILVNTFTELEPHSIQWLSDDESVPKIYPVGPIVNLSTRKEGTGDEDSSIVQWLDNQPPSSVVFLCFGSYGSFTEEQVREVAKGLEKSNHRFLWSLRLPSNSDNFRDVLPEGFLDRTGEIGKVIGWAPQVEILSHPAVGGFVSHCGWNSTLESLWFGVPIAAWPMYAEQQMNAFQLVKETGLGVEMKLDYWSNPRKKTVSGLVEADIIEKGVRLLMEPENGVKKKVKEISEISKKTAMEGGSSYDSLGKFIVDVFSSISS